MQNKLLVVKIGGKIIDDSQALSVFLKNFSRVKHPKILVHGGGNIATSLSKKLGVTTQMVEGRRVTSSEDLEVVTMVYAGLISKNITATLQMLGCNAMGLAGCDANTLVASKRPAKPIDFGWVGDLVSVNTDCIKSFLDQGLSPVFSAICHDQNGQLLNTNADTIAAEIAIAMTPFFRTELVYCFEKNGVLSNPKDEDSVIPILDSASYERYKADGTVHAGMIPKLSNCFHALRNQVASVVIGNSALVNDHTVTHTSIKL